MWKKQRCIRTFVALESEKCGCRQKNALSGMGCKGEVDQTSKAGRLKWLNKNLHASAVHYQRS